jgi:hypothetical protein
MGGIAMLVLVLVFLLALPGGIRAEKTVEYGFPGGVDRVTFDPAVISEQEIARWMELSSVLGHYNYMLVPEDIELCFPDDLRYQHCSKGDNLENAQLNLDKVAARIKRLDPERYPPGLKKVVEYIRDVQKMSLWVEQQKLAFVRSNNLAVLEQVHGAVDPGMECADVIGRIRTTTDAAARSRLARFDWHNCVWQGPVKKELGSYPLGEWDSFLAAHGIRELEINTEED